MTKTDLWNSDDVAGWERALERYLARPVPDVLLVMVAPAPAADTKTGDDAEIRARSFPVEFAPLTGDRLPKWVAHHTSSEHGTTITPEACAMLIGAVGNDFEIIEANLFAVQAMDWVSFIGTAAIMLTAALIASLAPALRALRLDPINVDALKAEAFEDLLRTLLAHEAAEGEEAPAGEAAASEEAPAEDADQS